MSEHKFGRSSLPPFDREFFASRSPFSRIGSGEIGGKAQGLVFARDVVSSRLDAARFPSITVDIPSSVVISTDVFDTFMAQGDLLDVALSDAPDERIAQAFQKASFPVEHVGDLRALVETVHTPLAIRSSSLLEDAMFQPFAGVYDTKMIPNQQSDADVRFQRLMEAIKFVYASMFTKSAKGYLLATGRGPHEEKMAVVVQEVVGSRHEDRFYPEISGVARSYNFYPTGPAKPRDGVVSLALGLGKTIVDGSVCWTYSPRHPVAPPPFGSVRELMNNTQLDFWAVNMGPVTEYDPIRETEYLIQSDLKTAEWDGAIRHLASTYDPRSDRVVIGTGAAGPRVLNFAPLLQLGDYPVNEVVLMLLESFERAAGTSVEIEFAVNLPAPEDGGARLAFLQVRPMVVSDEEVDIDEASMAGGEVLLSSTRAMGNGSDESIMDVVYVKPDVFDASLTRRIATEIDGFNQRLIAERRPYLLIGFGRWGSSDPWLGIPVVWGQIGGARALVETTLPNMNVELSQGSHFFHNLSSFRVTYFSVRHDEKRGIDWRWLEKQSVVDESAHVRHVRLGAPLAVRVDGRSARGVILRGTKR